MRLTLRALTASLFFIPFSTACAQQDTERTAHEAMTRDIYENVIGFRTAKGHGEVPAMVSYLTGKLKDAGFSDADIQVTDYDIGEEITQGLIVYYRSETPNAKDPIVLLAHMDVVDALPEDWERPPFTLIEEDGYFFGRGTMDNKYGVTNLIATFIRLRQEGF